MKILVLSFYYAPDLCAGSFRCTALVERLKKYQGVEIDILTTMPNRYASFEVPAKEHEVDGNAIIKRIKIPSHNSGMIDQIRSFYVYYREVLRLIKGRDYDVVFATSSRLFTAFLGAQIARQKSVRLYLDIRDIFVDTIEDVIKSRFVVLLRPLLRFIENYTFSKANHINLVSKGFEKYFTQRFPKPAYSYFSNGIDSVFIENISRFKNTESNEMPTVLYAGNLGESQGLHYIIPGMALLMPEFLFKVVGDGGRKMQLQDSIQNLPNVQLLAPVSREELLEHYTNSDVLFMHLNDRPAFEKVLPSKVFEYAATGKPVLAGVGGYAADFIHDEVDNACVFPPCDAQQGAESLRALSLINTDRSEFIKKYSREFIMKNMADSIMS